MSGKGYDTVRLVFGLLIMVFFFLLVIGMVLFQSQLLIPVAGLFGLIITFVGYFAFTKVGEARALRQFSEQTSLPMVKRPVSPPSIPGVFYVHQQPVPFSDISNVFTVSPDFIIFTNTYWKTVPTTVRDSRGRQTRTTASEHEKQLCFLFPIGELKGYHTFILRYRTRLAQADEMFLQMLGSRYATGKQSLSSGVSDLDENYLFYTTMKEEGQQLIDCTKEILKRIEDVFPKQCSYMIEALSIKAEIHFTGRYGLVRVDYAAAPHLPELYPVIRDLQHALS